MIWLSGFLTAAGMHGGQNQVTPSKGVEAVDKPSLTILFGTESGNAEALAEQAQKLAAQAGFAARSVSMADYKAADLERELNLMVIVSTWGEGDPPEAAVPFHSFVMSDRAPKLPKTRFSVLSLGDTAYERFCQTGKDFDQRFEALGARRFHPRTDCDVDYDEPFQKWIRGALHDLSELVRPGTVEAAVAAAPAIGTRSFDRKNPFPAKLKDRILLNGRGSTKETIHVEFSLEGSGMAYQPGDSLAVLPVNCPQTVDELLKVGRFDPEATVAAPDGSEGPLREVLQQYYDITSLNPHLLKKYQEHTQNKKLAEWLQPGAKETMLEFINGRQIIDLLEQFPPPRTFTPSNFTAILRKIPPRLYSIASSLRAHPDEVHLTVAVVRHNTHERPRKGVASTFLADRIDTGDTVPVYIHPNKNFKLPENPDTPIIMVGPGTGVAPFRAFVEERAATGAQGKNWLIFGDRNYTWDFLYQLEWQAHLKSGVLTRLDVAFSRDQKDKIYVQDRLRQHGREIHSWLRAGAHFYVCGDASQMAGDVHQALQDIFCEFDGMSPEAAREHLSTLHREKRYQRDVY